MTQTGTPRRNPALLHQLLGLVVLLVFASRFLLLAVFFCVISALIFLAFVLALVFGLFISLGLVLILRLILVLRLILSLGLIRTLRLLTLRLLVPRLLVLGFVLTSILLALRLALLRLLLVNLLLVTVSIVLLLLKLLDFLLSGLLPVLGGLPLPVLLPFDSLHLLVLLHVQLVMPLLVELLAQAGQAWRLGADLLAADEADEDGHTHDGRQHETVGVVPGRAPAARGGARVGKVHEDEGAELRR